MWPTLKKQGVLAEVIQLICSFRMGMEAKTCLDESILEQLSVQNGLRYRDAAWLQFSSTS